MKKLFSRIVCILSILVIMIPFFSLIGSADDDEGAEASDSSEVPSKLPLAAETLSTDYDSLLSYVKSFGCFDYVTDESGVEYQVLNLQTVKERALRLLGIERGIKNEQ